MIPPGYFPPRPPGPSPFAARPGEDDAAPTPRARSLAPWAAGPDATTPAPAPPSPALPPLAPPPPLVRTPDGLADSGATPTAASAVPEAAAHDPSAPAVPGPFATSATDPLAAAVPDPSPAPVRTGGRRRYWLLPLMGSGLLAAGVMASLGWLTLRPWLTPPDGSPVTIAARFATVRHWAQPSPEPEVAKDLLLGAALLVSQQPARIPRRSIPLVEPNSLSREERDAVDGLLRWRAARGTFASSGCLEAFAPEPPAGVPSAATDTGTASAAPAATDADRSRARPSAYYTLGALAFATSRGSAADRSRAEAALALADAMQAEGSLPEYLVGLRLATVGARWMKARRQRLPGGFEPHRPRPEQLRAALARQALCALDGLGPGSGFGLATAPQATSTAARPPLGLIATRRERWVIMDFYGRWLASHPGDVPSADELVESLSTLSHPRSAVLEASLPAETLLEALIRELAAIDRLMPPPAKKASTSRPKAPTPRRTRATPRRPASSAPVTAPGAP